MSNERHIQWSGEEDFAYNIVRANLDSYTGYLEGLDTIRKRLNPVFLNGEKFEEKHGKIFAYSQDGVWILVQERWGALVTHAMIPTVHTSDRMEYYHKTGEIHPGTKSGIFWEKLQNMTGDYVRFEKSHTVMTYLLPTEGEITPEQIQGMLAELCTRLAKEGRTAMLGVRKLGGVSTEAQSLFNGFRGCPDLDTLGSWMYFRNELAANTEADSELFE